ncbi:type II toxin-antitoxin system HicA family toxin [Rosistilla oblonga]|uniref:type II toxin-antitoxin system HicA family toxin n=1 Tax=Rosistilla oblonga TaxID=2527990 RepID=UPI003A9714A7
MPGAIFLRFSASIRFILSRLGQLPRPNATPRISPIVAAPPGLLPARVCILPTRLLTFCIPACVFDRLSQIYHPLGKLIPRCSMTVREVVHIIEGDGWVMVAQKGSHRQFKHPTKTGRVTVAGHPKEDIAPGTLNSILRQAGLKD